MVRKLKIYLDASIPSAFYDKGNPLRQKITRNWWENLMYEKYEIYISQVTDAELNETEDPNLKHKLLKLVEPIQVLSVPEEAEDLAQVYIENEIIPEDYPEDALHIAVTTLYELDVLVSWNFQHLVNLETRRKIKAVNLLKGLKEIEIASPEELGGGKYV